MRSLAIFCASGASAKKRISSLEGVFVCISVVNSRKIILSSSHHRHASSSQRLHIQSRGNTCGRDSCHCKSVSLHLVRSPACSRPYTKLNTMIWLSVTRFHVAAPLAAIGRFSFLRSLGGIHASKSSSFSRGKSEANKAHSGACLASLPPQAPEAIPYARRLLMTLGKLICFIKALPTSPARLKSSKRSRPSCPAHKATSNVSQPLAK